MEYIDYYYLEKYLFENVGPKFRKSGSLSVEDFFCIVIWKANRVKSKIAKTLLSKNANSLESAVVDLVRQILKAETQESKFSVLIKSWGFRPEPIYLKWKGMKMALGKRDPSVQPRQSSCPLVRLPF